MPLNTRGHLRADQDLRPRGRPGARARRARARGLEADQEAAQGQGAGRLEPERLLEDHRRRLLAALPRAALGLDAADLGRGRPSSPTTATPTRCASRRRRRSSGSPSTATCSRPVLELKQKLPRRIGSPATSNDGKGSEMATEAQQRARATWSAGDFDAIAAADLGGRRRPRRSGSASSEGERVLDVACGTGNAAIPAAAAGAEVTGLDITPELFEDAPAQRRRGRGRDRVGRGRRPGPAVRGRELRRRRLDLRLHVRAGPQAGRARDRAGAGAGRPARGRRLAPRGQHRPVLPDDRQVRAAAAGGISAAAALGRARPRHRDLRRHRGRARLRGRRRALAFRLGRGDGRRVLDQVRTDRDAARGARGGGPLGGARSPTCGGSTRRSPCPRTAASPSTAIT